MDIRNDHWETIQLLIRRGVLDYDELAETISVRPDYDPTTLRRLGLKHSFTLADPQVVAYVSKMAYPEVVEVDAGLAYWSSLLAQAGKKVAAYDRRPPASSWVPVNSLNSRRSELGYHREATLICMSDVKPFKSLTKALRAFLGEHVMFSANDDPYRHKALKAVLDAHWIFRSQFSGVCVKGDVRAVYEFSRNVPRWGQPTRLLTEVGRHESV